MNEIQCPQGHFYTPAYTGDQSCPHCATVNSNLFDTQSVYDNTEPVEPDFPPPNTDHAGGMAGDTQSVYHFDDIQSVVGWLVCEKGPSKGQDYRIISGRNFIGRGSESSIRVLEDNTISRERHAVISFNPRKRSFSLMNGESTGLLYHNDKEVNAAVELKLFDRIELGKSVFIFMPFCGADFLWPDLK